ncbi:hypothetical protein [Leucobacter aridicollis]|uniref:hypothetical protein n=1 Tax=Leucobacter aridicollis TaxID=283878 RepID=UPI0021053EF2|nr:hypothetical protein [Leucobacter aridicollis]UTX53374.1 hypothetical protein KI794_01005 [Leucobacter aridicollis]
MTPETLNYFGSVPLAEESDFTTLAEIRDRLAAAEGLFETWRRLAKATPKENSEWAADQRVTGPWMLSTSVFSALHHAGDSINTLREMLGGNERIVLPYMAHFAVARSGIEAASLAIWLLAPDQQPERIDRHIREIWREVNEESKIYASAIEISESDPAYRLSMTVDTARKDRKKRNNQHKRYIRDMARAHGLKDPCEMRHAVGFREITGAAAQSAGISSAIGEMVWSELSSLSHPSTLRAMRSNVEIVSDDPEKEIVQAQISTSIPTIGLAVNANLRLFEHALELVQRRKLRPFHTNVGRDSSL